MTAVLVAAMTLGAAWFVLEPTLVSTTDGALQKKMDAAIDGDPVPLAAMTDFAWDRVQVFDEYDYDSLTRDWEISYVVGDRVDWEPATTSYSGPSLWVFSKDGEAVRAVQLDTNAPEGRTSWRKGVKVSGGPHHNVLHLVE
ncbi:hypothetical protein AB0D04_18475 [Streptomyces sp. NPDC048483]|uniref:hypothetical protein n=1 Tax=Streptomyces sp. NPDC048483 TaxID=3154927 RepID=UPI003414536E